MMMIVLSVKIYSVQYDDIGLLSSLCCKEGVLQQVESCRPLGWVLREHLSNQVFQRLREVVGDGQFLLSRIDLYLELALPVEWQRAIVYEGEEHDPEGPDVCWPRVVATLLYDVALRCSEAGRPLAIEELVPFFELTPRAREIG